MSVNSQRGGGEESALGAMRQSVPQHTTRRTACLALYFLVIPDVVIEKALNLFGAGQPPDNREFPPLQSEIRIHILIVTAVRRRRQKCIFQNVVALKIRHNDCGRSSQLWRFANACTVQQALRYGERQRPERKS